ncbi:MAG: hypothetical protein ABL949_16935 [Fimbriimonadaceae bacterium]
MPIVVTTKSRSTPYLQEYVRHLMSVEKEHLVKFGVFGGIIGTLGGVGGTIFGVLGGTGALGLSTGQVVTGVIAIGLATAAGIGATAWNIFRGRKPNPDEAMLEEAKQVGQRLQTSIQQRKLYREMHPAALDLLEESARCWKRVKDAVDGPFWRSEQLPVHYQGIRTQSQISAERAMMEILINLRSAVRPVAQPQTVIEGVQAILDSVGINIGSEYKSDDPLPEGFQAAAKVAHDLAQLATEVEQASVQAIKSSAPTNIDSSENIRQTLEDLKNIRQAETELEQDLRVNE